MTEGFLTSLTITTMCFIQSSDVSGCRLVSLEPQPPGQDILIYSLIREFRSVFNSNGNFVPVKYYECIINTGNAWPIAVKKILHGKRKTFIMQHCIAALAKVGHIE